jgi:hypothetical protein
MANEDQRNDDQRRYVFSSNLKFKLSNFMTAGRVRTSIAVDETQRRPLWGETWVEHTWWEVQPHLAVLQAGEASRPPAVFEVEETGPPKVEKEQKE